MDIHAILHVLIKPFRKKRMANFLTRIRPKLNERILDVGGTVFNWKLINYEGNVTILNLSKPSGCHLGSDKYEFIVGDGTKLDFPDNSFSVVFSNSVIEHLGTYEKQKMFALEARRVGKRLWIQTPAKNFCIEPHYITPFVHFFPQHWQKCILRNFSVWGLIARPSQSYVNKIVDELRLLKREEMKQLFPDCEIIKEKVLFVFTKSYIAVR